MQYALAICDRPDLLVLDEPTAMDRASARALWATVRDAASQGAAVLMTTHDIAEADALADRVVVMDAGRIVADDTLAAIRALAGGAVVRCRSVITQANAAALPGVRQATSDGAELRLVTTDAAATVRRLAELAQQYDVHPNLINQWRSRLLEGAADVFGAEPAPAEPVVDVTALHAKIGELTLANDFLAGALGKAGLLPSARR